MRTKTNYIKFLAKAVLLSFPLLLLIGIYMYLDPFKVVRNYQSYYDTNNVGYVALDRDYVSTQTFINNPENKRYDSFIFGNSRSLVYRVDVWKKYIPSNNCFHFDASGESLLGLYRKVVFLDTRGIKIKNAMIVLDRGLLKQTEEKEGHLFAQHPELSGKNRIAFQIVFFKDFLSPEFMRAYFYFVLTGKIKNYMKEGHFLDDVIFDYDLLSNEIRYQYFEDLISQRPESFYNNEKMKVFYKRSELQKESDPVLGTVQIDLLKQLSEILKRHGTDFRIVINPLYDQEKFNSKDLSLMNNLFGKGRVFDFSGINGFTGDYHNYYENSHYRPHIADSIMQKIYGLQEE